MGILSRPLVKQPAPGEAEAPALGYFPDSALERIEQVRRMKAEGLSMAEIVMKLGASQDRPFDANNELARQETGEAMESRHAGKQRQHDHGLQLTLDDIAYPAYMVNYNFELTWYNEAAREKMLGFKIPPPSSEARNIFLMFTAAPTDDGRSMTNRNELLRMHITLAKARLSKPNMLGLVKNLDRRVITLVDELYDQTDSVPGGQTIVEVPYTLHDDAGKAETWLAHGIYFREGVLILHMPAGQADPDLLGFLSRRDAVIRNLLRKRLPVLTPLAVLVADLQNSVKICSELPPEEYFELINEIWATMTPIFRNYYGTHGKHVGDGMVYYFFPQPDGSYIFNTLMCAHEIKLEMRKISKAWQLRKNWLNELYLNIGLHEGQEWLGTFQSATSVEFAVLGDTINSAARLSDFARYGAIWATKNFISKLSADERAKVEFGISRRAGDEQEHFVVSSYSQVAGLVDLKSERYEKLREIATLPITEIRGIRT